MKKRAKRNAFSLLELLAVVVILGIIAAVVVPRVTTSSDSAKQAVNKHNIATLNQAVERYFVNEGVFPSALTDLVPGYVPDGIPDNPTGGGAYALDSDNRVVEGS